MFKLNKRKLLLLIPLTVLILGAGISLALAQSGHFKSLANLLNIKADVTTTSMPSTYTFCVLSPVGATSEYAGVYSKVSRTVSNATNGGIPYYQKNNIYLYAYPDLTYSNGVRWILNKTLDQPYYSSGPYTQFCADRYDINSCAGGPPNNSIWSWGNNNVALLGKSGTFDPNTCNPISGIHGKVKDANGAIISGATVKIINTNQTTTTNSKTDYNYEFIPYNPGTYKLVAYKDGYEQSAEQSVVIESGKIAELDFVLQASNQNGKPIGVAGFVTDEDGNPIQDIKIHISCAGYPCPLDPKGPWDLKTNNSLSIADDGSNKKYNYSQLGLSPISGSQFFLLEYTLPNGWYWDINLNNKNDDNWNGQLRIPATDFVNTPYTLQSGKYKVVYRNLVLKKNRISLFGNVVAQENQSLKIPADLSLYQADDVDNRIEISTDANGYYDFGELYGRVLIGKEYRLTAASKAIDPYRSPATESLIFSDDFSREIDFQLALNPSRDLRFTGFVRRIDDQGKDLGPISGATVSLERNRISGTFLGLNDREGDLVTATNTDTNGYYNLSVPHFWDSNGSSQTAINLALIAYDNQSIAADNFQVENYWINPKQGGVYRQDFNFSSDARKLNPDPKKDVAIDVFGTYKEDSVTNKIISQGPMSGVVVTLITLRTETNGNTTTVVKASATTNTDGRAVFKGFPQKEALIRLSNIPDGYQYADASQLTLSSSGTYKKIDLIKYNYKLTSPEMIKKFNQQDDDRWADDNCVGFDNNLGPSGCCITSLANAIQFYNPTATVTPDMLADLGQDCNMSSDNFQALQKSLSQQNNFKDLNIGTIQREELAKYNGIPIIYHAVGIPVGNSDQKHGGHCVLILSTDGNNVTYYDPNAWNGQAVVTIPISSLPGNDLPILVLQSTGPINSISSQKRISIKSSVAYAATIANQISTPDNQDLIIDATVQSFTIIPFERVYLIRNVNGVKDAFLMQKTSGDNYTVTIPYGIITTDFNYKIVAVNGLNKQYSGESTNVVVTKTPNTVAKKVGKQWSSFVFYLNRYLSNNQIINSLDNQIQTMISRLKAAYNNILVAFKVKSINLGSVSGHVYKIASDGSKIPAANVLVQIGGNVAQVDESGAYIISNIPKGSYVVEIQGLSSASKGNLAINSGNQATVVAGKNTVLDIVLK